jgi:uncharacterized protein YndB with AHSA1/START domain
VTRPAHTSRAAGVVTLERRIAAPLEIVFSYFIDPKRYALWQGIEAELDPRPGGTFRVRQNDAGLVSRGEFIEIDPPNRLVFSWGWEGVDDLLPGQSTVEIVLQPDGDGTLLRLRHSGLPSEPACELHSYGWGVGLDNLVVVAAAGHLPNPT